MTNFLKIYRYILYVLAAVPIIRIYLDGMENDYNPEAYTIILLVNIYMLLCSRKNFMMLMITLVIGYCNYSKKEHPTFMLVKVKNSKFEKMLGEIGQDVLF